MTAPKHRGIGGSTIGAICGLSVFATALDVWRRLVLGEDEDADNPATQAGRRFEPFVLDAYRKQSQSENLWTPEPVIDGWRRYSPDALSENNGWRVLVEAKTTAMAAEWGADDSDEIPPSYAAQGTWGLDMLGLDVCEYPVLCWPKRQDMRALLGLTPAEIVALLGIRVLRISFNPLLAAELRDRAEQFWNEHVIARVPPPPADLDDIKRFVRKASGVSAEMDETIAKLARDVRQFRLAIADLKEQGEHAEFHLREAARQRGDVETFMQNGWPVLTLKPQERQAHSVKASRSQPIRFTNRWQD